MWLLVLITISGTMAMHMFVPALPAAARGLGSTAGQMQMAISIYIIGLAAGQLCYGPLSDALGRRPLLMTGLALYTAGGLAAAFAPGLRHAAGRAPGAGARGLRRPGARARHRARHHQAANPPFANWRC